MQPEQQQRIMGYFIEEAKEHLNTIEQGLLNLHSTLADPEMMNELFRAAHSVKGGAAMLGLNSIQQVSHRLEDSFKILKDTPIKPDQRLESLFLQVFDALQDLLGQLQSPYGLTDETATATISGVEPTFDELEKHLNSLAGLSDTSQPVVATTTTIAQQVEPEPVPQPNDDALILVFRDDITAQLRSMLQLFKQPERNLASRQQLQDVCRNLARVGEQFNLPTWCSLVETARLAIDHSDNAYRTLAPVVIRDIKQAQDLVLLGRVAEIAPSTQLQQLVPFTVEISDDLADLFDTSDSDNFVIEAPSALDESLTFEEFETSQSSSTISFESNFSEQPIASQLNDKNGPEVGMAELNSLADLFENDIPDLGSTWQEEEVLNDISEGITGAASHLSNLDAASDFSDLLFDEPETVQPAQTDESLSDLLDDELFNEDSTAASSSGDQFAASSADAFDNLDELSELPEPLSLEQVEINDLGDQEDLNFDAFEDLDLGTLSSSNYSSSIASEPYSGGTDEQLADLNELFADAEEDDISASGLQGLETSLSYTSNELETALGNSESNPNQSIDDALDSLFADPWSSTEEATTASALELPNEPTQTAAVETGAIIDDFGLENLQTENSSADFETIEELTDEGDDTDFSSLFEVTAPSSSDEVEELNLEALADEPFDLSSDLWSPDSPNSDISEGPREQLDVDLSIATDNIALEQAVTHPAVGPADDRTPPASSIPDPWDTTSSNLDENPNQFSNFDAASDYDANFAGNAPFSLEPEELNDFSEPLLSSTESGDLFDSGLFQNLDSDALFSSSANSENSLSELDLGDDSTEFGSDKNELNLSLNDLSSDDLTLNDLDLATDSSVDLGSLDLADSFTNSSEIGSSTSSQGLEDWLNDELLATDSEGSTQAASVNPQDWADAWLNVEAASEDATDTFVQEGAESDLTAAFDASNVSQNAASENVPSDLSFESSFESAFSSESFDLPGEPPLNLNELDTADTDELEDIFGASTAEISSSVNSEDWFENAATPEQQLIESINPETLNLDDDLELSAFETSSTPFAEENSDSNPAALESLNLEDDLFGPESTLFESTNNSDDLVSLEDSLELSDLFEEAAGSSALPSEASPINSAQTRNENLGLSSIEDNLELDDSVFEFDALETADPSNILESLGSTEDSSEFDDLLGLTSDSGNDLPASSAALSFEDDLIDFGGTDNSDSLATPISEENLGFEDEDDLITFDNELSLSDTDLDSPDDFADLDNLLAEQPDLAIDNSSTALDSTVLDNLSSSDSTSVTDEFAGLDRLLDQSSAPAGDTASIQLDNLFAADTSEQDEFAELDELLGEEPSSIEYSSDSANLFDRQPVNTDPVPMIDTDDRLDIDLTNRAANRTEDFADLEALLQGSAPEPANLSTPQLTDSSKDSEFDELDDLLKDAEEKLGGSPTVKVVRGMVPQNRRLTRPGRVFSEQTMRVPVKHLDNLSNLVGELVVNRNSLEQDQERLRQSLDNLLYQIQQLSDVGQRMQDLYERSLLESSLLASRQSYRNASSIPLQESSTSTQTARSTEVEYDPLEMDRFTGFHSLSQEMIELIVRVRESSSDIEFIVDETDQVTRMFRQVTTQLQEGLTRSRMVPFAQTADRLPRAVRDIAMKVGKQAELQVEGRETLIDKMILEQLYDPMTHLVNNAITHGIETPEVRRAAGKAPAGRITIRAFHQGNQTIISVSDDGAGINVDHVKAKALEKGLITPAEARNMTRLDVYDLLFHPGFSTKDQADDFSGRGVGMDVVRTSLSEIRGVINTDSNQGKGTTFTIRLPLTLSISKALCCISDRARIAFPMDGVEDMLDVPKDRVQTNPEGESCIPWRDTLLPLRPLNELLSYNRHLSRGNVYGGSQDDDVISIVVLRSAGNFLALEVDQVLGEQEIVIKQLEGPVPKPVGVAGATVLGDGRIMPIADVLELIDLSMGRIRKDVGGSLWEQGGPTAVQEAPVTKTEPTVLIVDDSITVRELLSMTFNKVGYRVEQARDGQEAWEKLRAGLPCDIVFCDIEMPRMDGLELLSRIQKDPHLNSLPIAMLTSRGADRHRQMAASLGASGYFTKPYLEEALLDAAQRMLKGEMLISNVNP